MLFARPMSSFLRPLATASPAPARQLLRFFSQSACRTTASATEPATTPASSSSQAEAPKLPYFVQRTPSKYFPIYKLSKNGGNLKQTRLRKIVGDTKALRNDLKAFLNVPDNDIVINSVTGHIIVKGWHKPAIEAFLTQKMF